MKRVDGGGTRKGRALIAHFFKLSMLIHILSFFSFAPGHPIKFFKNHNCILIGTNFRVTRQIMIF